MKKTKAPRGFSLIEILVALVIIAVITALTVPAFNSIFRANSQAFSRKVSSLFRDAHDFAVLRGAVVRVIFDLKAQEYWVEEGPASVLLPSKAELEKAEHDKTQGNEKKDDKEPEPSEYRLAKQILSKKTKVPQGVKVAGLIVPRHEGEVTEGTAEIYYFPSGAADPAVVHLEDQDGAKYSLIIHPITGAVRIEQGKAEADK